MSTITRYVIVTEANHEEDYEYPNLDEAQADAEERCEKGERLAVIERQYTYEDSELVWTSNGGSTWPPRARR